MLLNHGIHLGYCTNIHRGETWAETLESLNHYTLAIRERVCPSKPYGIGLRLSDQASRQLSDPATLSSFRRWLDQNNCYVFTINGFPFGRFHGKGVKEGVYLPDWTSQERLDYTNRLFDLLAQLLPAGVEGSVSTLPGSFKEFTQQPDQLKAIRANLFQSVKHVSRLCEQADRKMHLGLEPEPLCLLENTWETVVFFDCLRSEHPHDDRVEQYLGVNYDTCHLAVEFEDPAEAMARLRQHQIKISKIHLSSALSMQPTPKACEALAAFADQTYLHQVIVRNDEGKLSRYRDLGDALTQQTSDSSVSEQWRIHFHVPLHSPSGEYFGNTSDHLLGVLDILAADPGLCSNLEMETYTWEVMPPELKNRSVVDQLVGEYDWCLRQLACRGLALI